MSYKPNCPRWFLCSKCHYGIILPKRTSTNPMHIKTMYCPKCKEDKDFKEVDFEVLKK